MQAVELSFAVTLLSATHIGTGLGIGQILDDRTVRGPHPDLDGVVLPYLPGSSLKGRLRHHARLLAAQLGLPISTRQELEGDLFGFEQLPSALVFADAHLDLTQPAIAELQRAGLLAGHVLTERRFVSLSRQRRVALDQRLFAIDAAERGLPFRATIAGSLPAARAEAALALLLAAIAELTALGGMKGRGLGAVTCAIETAQLGGAATTLGKLLPKLEELL
jgi:CRISPR/Cas system CSM-associated protein Csm3 (group 7 of RAMP superfamily)